MKMGLTKGFVLGNLLGGVLILLMAASYQSMVLFCFGAIITLLAGGCWAVIGVLQPTATNDEQPPASTFRPD